MSSDDQDTRESRDQTTPSADEPVREGDDLAPDSSDAPEAAGDGEPVPEGPEPESTAPESPAPESPVADSPAPESPVAESTDAPQADPEPSDPEPSEDAPSEDEPSGDEPSEPEPEVKQESSEAKGESPSTFYDDPYDEYEYEYEEPQSEKSADVSTAQPEPAKTPPSPPPPVDTEDDEDDDEEGMSRMSFLDHLEELRTRIIRALAGLAVAYAISLTAKDYLFQIMRRPFDQAVELIKLTHPENTDMVIQLVALTPIEQFHLIWFKLPIVASLFIAAPWWMLQVWSFVAPGLYKKERSWVLPFILSGGLLFILGGAFGYFVALNFALAFLLDVGTEGGVVPLIGISAYADMFIGILLGLGVVFQMPIVIFVLTGVAHCQPQVPNGKRPLRDPGHLRSSGRHHAHARHFQHDHIRHADDLVVLRRYFSQLPLPVETGREEPALGQDVVSRLHRTRDHCRCHVLSALRVGVRLCARVPVVCRPHRIAALNKCHRSSLTARPTDSSRSNPGAPRRGSFTVSRRAKPATSPPWMQRTAQ